MVLPGTRVVGTEKQSSILIFKFLVQKESQSDVSAAYPCFFLAHKMYLDLVPDISMWFLETHSSQPNAYIGRHEVGKGLLVPAEPIKVTDMAKEGQDDV